jgi:hypothetical protein
MTVIHFVTLFPVTLNHYQPLVRTWGYRRIVLYSTLGQVGGGNSCGGYTLLGVAVTHAG